MSQRREKSQLGARVAKDLEAYRRLVELQKQMIELSQHHEQSRRELEALRTQVAREIAARLRGNPTFSQRLRTACLRLNWFPRKATAC